MVPPAGRAPLLGVPLGASRVHRKRADPLALGLQVRRRPPIFRSGGRPQSDDDPALRAAPRREFVHRRGVRDGPDPTGATAPHAAHARVPDGGGALPAATSASRRRRRRLIDDRPASRACYCENVELFDSFRARFPFELDDFQVEAIRAIEAGQSVIVSAPTGAGKTLVAEFAIHLALAQGRRIAYTTPLKALSNQKFADFVRAYGEDQVGILTGDVKVNPHARVLVMTTEILRNALYGGGMEDLGFIVLDECHYMGDEGRGTVWEEIIVNAPSDVALVALSATVANVNEIADWISIVHRPIVPIYHPTRPVPLSFAIADLAGDVHDYERVRAGRVRVVGDESRGPDERSRWFTRRVVDPPVLIDELASRGWLPAIYFIFSRVGCERALDDVLQEGKSLLTRDEARGVDAAIREAVADSPALGESTLNQTVFAGLRLGVGLHHAGVLPGLKRLIEVLFERGRCKVVFATETMSLGIHMPAKWAAAASIRKASASSPSTRATDSTRSSA
ncbi:MAG: hypothetical protein DMD81_17855 [Candidatus Rokuibacteriota bacterium]|nr:MAG: hypothetical protein DMD81_17855 [Candidatus Rokubacteria bacterium]